MTFARYFRISSYCLIAAGFVALASTGSIDTVLVVLSALILAGSCLVDTAKIRRRIPSWALNSLAFACVPFFVVDFRLLSRSLTAALIHLILFLAAVKLLTISKDRDYFVLYLISFAELLAASTLTVNITFGICFLIFLISGVSSLILFEMSRSNASLRNRNTVQPLVVPDKLRGTPWELFPPFPAGLLCMMTLGITLLIILIAAPVFFLLPRIAFGLQKQPSGKTHFVSGFSERVELGQIGRINLSDAVVMRVKLSNSGSALPADIKWRGLAFDYYDGRSWKRTDLHRSGAATQGRFYKLESSVQGTDLLFQTFFVEALSTDVVFAAHKALAVSREVGLLQRDSAENLYASRPLRAKLRYSAISNRIEPNPENIPDVGTVPPEIRSKYLQLPAVDRRIAKLARRAAGKTANRYAQARSVEKYLRSHYEYSLDLRGIPNSKDPLAVFLFDARKGHCEYFASAMVIMLRTLGIPARLVNGFRSGEYNSIGGNWIVRQYNAHSWVEAYFPPYGWLEFDPTPPDPQHPKAAIARFLTNLTDALDLWWWEGVVNYDYSKQYRMLGRLGNTVDRIQDSVARFPELAVEKFNGGTGLNRIGKWMVGVMAVAVPLAFVSRKRLSRIFHRLQRTMLRKSTDLPAHNFYMDALGLLREKGIERSPNQTPLELACSLEGRPGGEPFLILTRLYNAARFGPPDGAPDCSEAPSLLRTLHDSLENSR